MTAPVTHEVTGCAWCPLCDSGRYFDSAPEQCSPPECALALRVGLPAPTVYNDVTGDVLRVAPAGCPLRTAPVLVRLRVP